MDNVQFFTRVLKFLNDPAVATQDAEATITQLVVLGQLDVGHGIRGVQSSLWPATREHLPNRGECETGWDTIQRFFITTLGLAEVKTFAEGLKPFREFCRTLSSDATK